MNQKFWQKIMRISKSKFTDNTYIVSSILSVTNWQKFYFRNTHAIFSRCF